MHVMTRTNKKVVRRTPHAGASVESKKICIINSPWHTFKSADEVCQLVSRWQMRLSMSDFRSSQAQPITQSVRVFLIVLR